MSDQSGPLAQTAGERRRNPILRALINEMLERVRELNRNASNWSPAERQRAEEELSDILARVRGAATEEHQPAEADPTSGVNRP